MARIPDPQPGLVISYAYLWHREAARDRHEGTKYRPAVVVMAVEHDGARGKTVLVAPITHRQPEHTSAAVEIPPQTKRRLGLDPERSWIIVSEVNRFEWPGPDLLPIAPGEWAYGILPAGLFRVVRNRIADTARRRKLAQVRREP